MSDVVLRLLFPDPVVVLVMYATPSVAMFGHMPLLHSATGQIPIFVALSQPI